MINARAETLGSKAAFRDSIKERRCLVLADSFYEWEKTASGKIPHRILMKDEEPFAFAGLWDRWKDAEGRDLFTFTIITVDANALVNKIHDRMPAILQREQENAWLDEEVNGAEAAKLLNPFPEDQMKTYTVSQLVNSAGNEKPEVIEPFEYKDLFS